ncbi:oxygenase MpaB family protein [Streptomyces sp. NPDC058701]|uniref:oxygenase MpaB family protein n=1 Tax=Streptomyces sp. NPDC058701 TaxID=3346608 RepID=UPI003668F28F
MGGTGEADGAGGAYGAPHAGGAGGGADPGLFGPRSVTWQCHGDPVMWIAGVRALYLQALHPRAVRGVVENSTVFGPGRDPGDARHRKDPRGGGAPRDRGDAWGRLLRTADFVGTTTYGTTEAAERAGARVRKIHRMLSATDPDTGERFPVDDPKLLLWIHCAQIDSFLHVLRRSGVPLTPGQADLYVDENRAGARLVGLDPAGVPADAAQLAAYFETVRPELAAGPDARAVDAFLRSPPIHPLLVPGRNLLWGPLASLAYATLPGWAHRLYGRPAPAPLVTTRRLRLTGLTLRSIPAGLRWQLPPGHILKAMRRMGPGSRPSPYTLRTSAAILDGPGRAWRDDGGGFTTWRSPD